MKRFKNISLVYPCDTSTMEKAATLTLDNRAKLTIVCAVRELPTQSLELIGGDRPIDVGKLVLQDVNRRLKGAAATMRSLGVRPETRLFLGEPSTEIVRDVIDQQRDLVIMTAEGPGGLKRHLFGSISRQLMRKCPVPLFVMKPSRKKRFHRILAAVDPTFSVDSRSSMNGLILDLSRSLADRENAELHVVHAWTLIGETVMRGRAGLQAADVDRAVRQEATQRRELVRNLLAKHSIPKFQLHLPKGEAADLIPRLVQRLKVDLLVMGTVCRTGIPGFFIGNTAERVLDMVDCSVLVVKPEGFVSPIGTALPAGSRANRSNQK